MISASFSLPKNKPLSNFFSTSSLPLPLFPIAISRAPSPQEKQQPIKWASAPPSPITRATPSAVSLESKERGESGARERRPRRHGTNAAAGVSPTSFLSFLLAIAQRLLLSPPLSPSIQTPANNALKLSSARFLAAVDSFKFGSSKGCSKGTETNSIISETSNVSPAGLLTSSSSVSIAAADDALEAATAVPPTPLPAAPAAPTLSSAGPKDSDADEDLPWPPAEHFEVGVDPGDLEDDERAARALAVAVAAAATAADKSAAEKGGAAVSAAPAEEASFSKSALPPRPLKTRALVWRAGAASQAGYETVPSSSSSSSGEIDANGNPVPAPPPTLIVSSKPNQDALLSLERWATATTAATYAATSTTSSRDLASAAALAAAAEEDAARAAADAAEAAESAGVKEASPSPEDKKKRLSSAQKKRPPPPRRMLPSIPKPVAAAAAAGAAGATAATATTAAASAAAAPLSPSATTQAPPSAASTTSPLTNSSSLLLRPPAAKAALFAAFDGHGPRGHAVSCLAAATVPAALASALGGAGAAAAAAAAADAADVSAAMRCAFETADAKARAGPCRTCGESIFFPSFFLSEGLRQKNAATLTLFLSFLLFPNKSKTPPGVSGSTATVVMVTAPAVAPSTGAAGGARGGRVRGAGAVGKLHVAWVGDSRAVLARCPRRPPREEVEAEVAAAAANAAAANAAAAAREASPAAAVASSAASPLGKSPLGQRLGGLFKKNKARRNSASVSPSPGPVSSVVAVEKLHEGEDIGGDTDADEESDEEIDCNYDGDGSSSASSSSSSLFSTDASSTSRRRRTRAPVPAHWPKTGTLAGGASGAVRRPAPIAVDLTRDHRPCLPQERARIEASGGRVARLADDDGTPVGPSRVWLSGAWAPGLAMSRALGDTLAGRVGVIATPECVGPVALGPRDRFLIVASDGVWEFIGSQEAVEIVGRCPDPATGARALVAAARERWASEEEGGADDVTAVVVQLDAEMR